MTARFWLAVAGINGVIAVAAGAYGYHALGVRESGFRDIFLTGAQYHMSHALALLGVAFAADRIGGRAPAVAGAAFASGILLFSGSLYYMGLTESAPVHGAAPFGGMLLMAGWVALVWAGVSSGRTP